MTVTCAPASSSPRARRKATEPPPTTTASLSAMSSSIGYPVDAADDAEELDGSVAVELFAITAHRQSARRSATRSRACTRRRSSFPAAHPRGAGPPRRSRGRKTAPAARRRGLAQSCQQVLVGAPHPRRERLAGLAPGLIMAQQPFDVVGQ